jgi:heat shock protein HslJ
LRRLLIGLAIATVGVTIAACSSGGSGSSGGTGGTLDGTGWTLKTYDVSGTATDVPEGIVVDAKFAAGKVAGFAGCNTYTGPATVDGAKLTVGALATTMKACDAAVSAVETAYLANLGKSATFTATADSLTIFDADGKQMLTYVPAAANPLLGEWNVTSYNNGKEATVGPIAGTELTATFTPDGKVAGSSGCNTYTGSYELEGTALTVGPLATTMMACEQEIMDQETQFLAAFQTPTTVETSGTTVTLRDADGAAQVILAQK